MLRNAANPKTRATPSSSRKVRTTLMRDKRTNTCSGRALIGAYGPYLRDPVYYLRDGLTPERRAATVGRRGASQSSTTWLAKVFRYPAQRAWSKAPSAPTQSAAQ